MVEELLSKDFSSAINAKIPILIDFWAPWCGPCRALGPVFDKLSQEYKSRLRFAKMNIESESNNTIASDHNIRSIPCMIMFSKGKEVERIVGMLQEPELRRKIDLALAKTL